jgi:hypothetical protein
MEVVLMSKIEVQSEPNRDEPLWLDPAHDRGRLFGSRFVRGCDIPSFYHDAVRASAPIPALREAAAFVLEAASLRVEQQTRLRWAADALRTVEQ